MKVRPPRQAGMFYAGSANALAKQVEECFLHPLGPGMIPKVDERGPKNLIALISPHAGYMYSGPIAAHAYHRLALSGAPASVVIVGPNHTGLGSGVSIATEGVWRTPLGDVQVDIELARAIQRSSQFIDVDDVGHSQEHSIEVQLPFLQYLFGSGVKLVPVCMMMQDLEVSRDVGEAIGKSTMGKNAVVIASTDLTHYEPQEFARTKDRMVVEAILSLDEERLHSVVGSRNISMCGCGPVCAAVVAAKRLGAKEARLLSYKTSGDVTGDRSQVVGYASLAVTRG